MAQDIDNQENNERQFKGIWISKEIYLATDLSWSEKILLVEIDSLSHAEKGCFASNDYFGKFLGGIHPTNIAKMITKLEKLGLVKRLKSDGRHRYLMSCPENFRTLTKADLVKTPRQGWQKHQGCISENTKHINTYNNTEIKKDIPKGISKEKSPAKASLPKKSPKEITPEILEDIQKRFPTLNVSEEKEAMQDHFANKNEIIKDWPARLRQWCRNALKFGAASKPISKKVDIETNKETAQRLDVWFKSRPTSYQKGRTINACAASIEFANEREHVEIRYSEETFDQQLNQMYKKWQIKLI
jgi:hypothetical protein